MPISTITAVDDPRLEDFRDIRDRDVRGPDGRPGVFIGEQTLVVEKMLHRPELVRRVLVSEPRRGWLETALEDAGSPDVDALVAPRSILEAVAGFPIHRGVIASGNRATLEGRSVAEIVPPLDRPATVLVLESIRNIDNIGMLFRVAAAFGVDAVVLSPDCHDPLYRKSLRVSIGHALSIPFARSDDWREDLESLRDRSALFLIGASVGDGSILPEETPRAARDRVALVMGSEFDGLGTEATATCDVLVRIAMATGVDSLNVGVAAAVLLDRFSTAPRA
jgi:tRNA G18 (ribose-2'-O)-methylase SpoU